MNIKIVNLTPNISCVHKFFAIGDEVEIDFKKIRTNISGIDDKETAEVTKTECDVMYAKLKDGRLLGLGNFGTAVRLLRATKSKVTRVPCYWEIITNAQQKFRRYPFAPVFPGSK